MKILKLGSRMNAPAFFDMAARFKPTGAHWYGQGFRIGDRAAAYVYLKVWREANPHRKLIVVEDNHIPGTEYSRWLSASWLFKEIADEIWKTSSGGETVRRPNGDALYVKTLWAFWKSFRRSARTLDPVICPDDISMFRADTLLQEMKVPARYVTLQPLFDAKYDRHRNQSPAWWQALVERTAGRMPTVVLGVHPNLKHIKLPHNCYPIIARGVDPMVSLALIYKGVMHAGGATGTTLWAPILKRPTVAIYKTWAPMGGTDVRPISFGRPVIFSPLHDSPEGTASRLSVVYEQVKEDKKCAV